MPATATISTRGIQGESLSAATDRLINTVLLSEGVVDKAGNSYQVLQNLGTDMNVKVGSGTAYDRAVVQGDLAGQGTFIPEHQNATQVLAVAASDPTLARKDIVVLRVYDDTFDSSGNDYADIEVIGGTPNATPVEPSVPSSALKLAVVDVGAAVTQIVNGDITDSRIAAVLNGDVTPNSMLRMERSTNQSIPDTTNTALVFTSTIFEVDDTGRITPNTGTGVVTVNEAGIYRITAGVKFNANGTGRRELSINAGASVAAMHTAATVASPGTWGTSISSMVKLVATDTITVKVLQTSGGSLDVLGGLLNVTVEWVGPSS